MATGNLSKNDNGHYCFEIETHSPHGRDAFMMKSLQFLTDEAGFGPPQAMVPGPDGAYMDLHKGDVRITVGYDTWTGVFVSAHCAGGDAVIRQIAVRFSNPTKFDK